MKKAIIHIGGHKTGTSAIQTSLHENAEILKKFGLIYPLELTNPQEKWALGQHSIVYSLKGFDKFSQKASQIDKPLIFLKEIPRDKNLLLSTETFMELDDVKIAELKNILTGFDVRIILYVRRQDESMQGLYQTDVVNNGYFKTFDEYFQEKKELFDYVATARKWQKIFNENSIIVRVYETNDAVADFVSTVENILENTLNYAEWNKTTKRINYGLPIQIVMLIRYYNKHPSGKQIRLLLKELGHLLYENKLSNGYDIVSPSRCLAILDFYSESNRALANEFFPSRKQMLFEEPVIMQTDDDWKRKYNFDGSYLKVLLQDILTALTEKK